MRRVLTDLTITKEQLELIAVFAFTMVLLSIPWEEIKGTAFRDLQVYREYFLYQQSILNYKPFSSITDYIVNEYLWHFIIGLLITKMNLPADMVFTAITAICLTTFSIFIVRRHGLISLLFLINPLVIDLAFSQLRMALAISLLLFAYMSKSKTWTILFAGLSIFIHSASFLFIFIYFFALIACCRVYNLNMTGLPVFFFLCAIGITCALFIGPFREPVLSIIGDRRAQYSGEPSSIAYTSFWIAFLFSAALQARRFTVNKIHNYSIIILSLVTANSFFGTYATRFLAASFPVLSSTMLSSGRPYKILTCCGFFMYATLQWLYWIDFFSI